MLQEWIVQNEANFGESLKRERSNGKPGKPSGELGSLPTSFTLCTLHFKLGRRPIYPEQEPLTSRFTYEA